MCQFHFPQHTKLSLTQASCSTLDLAPADDTSSVDPSSSSESEEHDHDSSSTDIDQDFDISFLSTEMEPTHEDTVKVSVSTSLSTPLVDIVECEEPHSPVLSSVVISSEASRDTEQSPSHDPSTQSEDTLPVSTCVQ